MGGRIIIITTIIITASRHLAKHFTGNIQKLAFPESGLAEDENIDGQRWGSDGGLCHSRGRASQAEGELELCTEAGNR